MVEDRVMGDSTRRTLEDFCRVNPRPVVDEKGESLQALLAWKQAREEFAKMYDIPLFNKGGEPRNTAAWAMVTR